MMQTKYDIFWGIDVSKNWVDIAIEGQVTRVKQEEKALLEFIAKNHTPKEKVLAILESTGGYEKAISHHLEAAGVEVHVAHPNKIVVFAKAKGRLAKTDKIDAFLLAQYGSFIQPQEIRRPSSLEQEELEGLSSRLKQLKEMYHQESCRLGVAQESWVRGSHQALLEVLNQQIKETEAHMMELIEKDEVLQENYQRLRSMKGVGPVLALTLVCDLPELGSVNKKEIAALVGVAPITKQSGKKTGKARIQYGRSYVRKVLYMAALVACRYNEKMRIFYERLLAAGKLKKVAIVAVMRKMLVTLNAMMQSKTCFNT